MQQTLVSAMMEGTDDSSTALPISTADLQQVLAVKIHNFLDTKNIAAIICTCDCCEIETIVIVLAILFKQSPQHVALDLHFTLP